MKTTGVLPEALAASISRFSLAEIGAMTNCAAQTRARPTLIGQSCDVDKRARRRCVLEPAVGSAGPFPLLLPGPAEVAAVGVEGLGEPAGRVSA